MVEDAAAAHDALVEDPRAQPLHRAPLVRHVAVPCNLTAWGFDQFVQGYLTHKKLHPPRTLPYAYAWGHRRVIGGWVVSYGRGIPVRRP